MHVPFVNLRLQYESIHQEIDEALKEVFSKSQFIGGDIVRKFEHDFAVAFKCNHCIATGNGTDALFIILRSLGIGPGDEVITPAFSCIASAEVISLTGANVVFADVHPEYYTIDPVEVEKKITTKTKAVIAVHLYGQAAHIEALKEICNRHNVSLVEDCAQAHFTEENTKQVGTFGKASAFSFYPTKNLGAYGDAGCILTQDELLAEKMRRFANHGALHKNDHAFEGTNSRLDTLQAALLSVKLKYVSQWNERRINIALLYETLLKEIPEITTPVIRPGTKHTFHIYAIRTKQRDALREYLASKNIETLIHYPKGLPFTDAYQFKHHIPHEFPVSHQLQDELLSLPIYPELQDEEVGYIASAIRNYFNR